MTAPVLLLTVEDLDVWPAALWESVTARLPEAEIARALGYRRPEDRQARLLGRLLILAGMERLGVAADLADLRISPDGRPSLPGPVDFSIAHTDGLVACAFSRDGPVGLDVERIRPVPLDAFTRYLSPAERRRIDAASDTRAAFFAVWTAKEAIAKAAGTGLRDPMPDTAAPPPVHYGGQSWIWAAVDVGRAHAAALAGSVPSAIERRRLRLDGHGQLVQAAPSPGAG